MPREQGRPLIFVSEVYLTSCLVYVSGILEKVSPTKLEFSHTIMIWLWFLVQTCARILGRGLVKQHFNKLCWIIRVFVWGSVLLEKRFTTPAFLLVSSVHSWELTALPSLHPRLAWKESWYPTHWCLLLIPKRTEFGRECSKTPVLFGTLHRIISVPLI